MVFARKPRWRQWAERWADRSARWASPSDAPCCACGKRSSASGNAALCLRCASAVAWIRDIRCDVCGRGEVCPDCVRRKHTYFECNRSAVRYTPTMKRWLAQYKYRGNERWAGLLAEMTEEPYRQLVKRIGLHNRRLAGLTYIPLSRERRLERGFNQAERLAASLGNRYGVPVFPLLRRPKHTHKQSIKSRQERLRDLEGVFEVSPKAVEALNAVLNVAASSKGGRFGRRKLNQSVPVQPALIVVDDVYTTGTTMNEASHVLTEALDCKVYGLTWAR